MFENTEDTLAQHLSTNSSVDIPLEDTHAWQAYPKHRWLYDKTQICNVQNIAWGPSGVEPTVYPVFQKPIQTMHGMGISTAIIKNSKEFAKSYRPGHFWMPLLEGRHLSVDVALSNGRKRYCFITEGIPGAHRRFNHWHYRTPMDSKYDREFISIKKIILEFVEQNLKGYTGFVNIEMIGHTIIEVHLRPSLQFMACYGKNFVDSLIKLYETGEWQFQNQIATDQYIVVAWADAKQNWTVDTDKLLNLKQHYNIHLDYDPQLRNYEYYNPPKSFRLGYVVTSNLEQGYNVVQSIKSCYTL